MLRPIVEAAGYLVIGEQDELSADVTIVSQGRDVQAGEGRPRTPPGNRSGCRRRRRTAFTATTAPGCSSP